MTDVKQMTEKQMREAKVPWLKSMDDLVEYIESLVAKEQDYGTCVYSMSMAAVATFQYMSGVIGSSGFQASCADMDIIRRTRMMRGPFAIVNGNDMLYPQYDIQGKVVEWLDKWKPWAAEEAQKLLENSEPENVAPSVWEHWQSLATEAKP